MTFYQSCGAPEIARFNIELKKVASLFINANLLRFFCFGQGLIWHWHPLHTERGSIDIWRVWLIWICAPFYMETVFFWPGACFSAEIVDAVWMKISNSSESLAWIMILNGVRLMLKGPGLYFLIWDASQAMIRSAKSDKTLNALIPIENVSERVEFNSAEVWRGISRVCNPISKIKG